jgi:5,10-methylenetetrahydromethanopterin reductase
MATPPELGLLVLPDRPLRELVVTAQRAEELDYQYLWVADEKFYRDPMVVLTAVTLNTSRLKLGTGVTEPYARHPALIAMALATLDDLSPGRVVVGIGAGGSGFPALGVARRKPAVALAEAVAMLRGLLAGERVTLDGEVLSLRDGALNFPPRPLPIYVAARGEQVLASAARIADGVIMAPFASGAAVSQARRRVVQSAERAARPTPRLVARVDVSIHEDPARARAAVRYFVALPLWVSYPNWGYLDMVGVGAPEAARTLIARRDYRDIREAAGLLPDAMVDHFAIAGTSDDVRRRFAELAPLVDQLLVHPVPAPASSMDGLIAAIAQLWKEAT